jgi:hypothetical protein
MIIEEIMNKKENVTFKTSEQDRRIRIIEKWIVKILENLTFN